RPARRSRQEGGHRRRRHELRPRRFHPSGGHGTLRLRLHHGRRTYDDPVRLGEPGEGRPPGLRPHLQPPGLQQEAARQRRRPDRRGHRAARRHRAARLGAREVLQVARGKTAMAITYNDLMQVDLGKLGTAVSDWKKAVANLKQLETDARDGLKKKSDRARWEGVNAGVTRKFVDKTVKEFAD